MSNPHNPSTKQTFIEYHEPNWLDDFEEHISAQWDAHPDANVFAFLDCAFSASCYAAIKKHQLPSRGLYDLSDKPSHDLLVVSPTLVPLTRETIAAWRDVLRHTDGWPMLSVIVTPESLDELALRLSPWCIVDADGESFCFRFPDTRLLPDVVSILTPQQHGEFFGPAYQWRYRTRSAKWVDLPLPKRVERWTELTLSKIAYPVADKVKLDTQQCARLIDRCEADQIMGSLMNSDPELVRKYDMETTYQILMAGLKSADLYHIAGADRAHWCELCLQQPQLEKMPGVFPLLGAMISKKAGYEDVMADLDKLVKSNAH